MGLLLGRTRGSANLCLSTVQLENVDEDEESRRPPGTDYKEDIPALRMMADAMIKDPQLKATAAARMICGSRWKPPGASDRAIIDRLVSKWDRNTSIELAATRARTAAPTVAPLSTRGSTTRVARSVPHGPPRLEVGRGQSHAVAAAAAFEARRSAWTGEQGSIAVDSRLLDACAVRGAR